MRKEGEGINKLEYGNILDKRETVQGEELEKQDEFRHSR